MKNAWTINVLSFFVAVFGFTSSAFDVGVPKWLGLAACYVAVCGGGIALSMFLEAIVRQWHEERGR